MQAKTEAFSIAGKACLPATYEKNRQLVGGFYVVGLNQAKLDLIALAFQTFAHQFTHPTG